MFTVTPISTAELNVMGIFTVNKEVVIIIIIIIIIVIVIVIIIVIVIM